jgi:hypothetical protein
VLAQACARRSAEGQTDGEAVCRQPPCPPRPRRREARQSLGEDALWADGVAAEQLADAEPPRDPVATPREIGQRPGIMTVDVPGRDITGRASDPRLG